MKTFAIALLVACAPLAAHAAETFTFSSAAKAFNGVRVPATGPEFAGGRIFDITTDDAFADGHKETAAGKCAGWTNPPGSQFPQTGVCSFGELYSLQYSCAAGDAPSGEANCWGLLVGTGGRYKGKTGVISYRSAQVIHGVGQWN
jgi:hypothetical protein